MEALIPTHGPEVILYGKFSERFQNETQQILHNPFISE